MQRQHTQKVSCYQVLRMLSTYANDGLHKDCKALNSEEARPHHAILAEHAFAIARNLTLETNLDTEHLNEPYNIVWVLYVR